MKKLIKIYNELGLFGLGILTATLAVLSYDFYKITKIAQTIAIAFMNIINSL